MSDENVLVKDLPEDEKRELLASFQECKLSGQIMTMTKSEASKMINDARGKTVQVQTPEQLENDNNKKENLLADNKPVATIVQKSKSEPNLPKCPRCYSPVKGTKCNACGLEVRG